MCDLLDGLNWTSLVLSVISSFLAGWFYSRHCWCRTCLAGTLFVLHKVMQRGVFLSTYDRAVLKVAADYLRRKS
jgi:hypothetical protein